MMKRIFWQISSHWDREWYKPFQCFRFELVKLMDNLLQCLEDGKLDRFVLDGQTVVIEDYLEIRPENKERVERAISSGKILAGPWYVMPDELCVSGESIIKNFNMGHRITKKFGGQPFKYGYMCDIFGHIGQMPQLLSGFGIKACYIGRGLGSTKQKYKNFLWYAPDGTYCFGHNNIYARLCEDFCDAADKKEVIYNAVNDAEHTGFAVLNFTHDHVQIKEHTFSFMQMLRELENEYELVGDLSQISTELEKYKEILPSKYGELIATAETAEDFRAVTGSLSSYYTLKRENDFCENLLENIVSPIYVFSYISGLNQDKKFLNLAYKYLLKNQAHDSICGCSSETVHTDMLYRYSQVKSISNAILDNFSPVASVNDEGFIKVLNTEPVEIKGVIQIKVLFEKNWGCLVKDNSRYQQINGFSLYDESGNEIEYEILEIKKDIARERKPNSTVFDEYLIAINSKLKPFGYTYFKIIKKNSFPNVNRYAPYDLSAENNYISMTVENDGSVTVLDKESGRVYKGLNTFVDDGEVGNGWFSELPVGGNTSVFSVGSPVVIEVICKNKLMSHFRVIKSIIVPKYADYNKNKRGEEKEELQIVSDIILGADSKTVKFSTTVENNVRDHRLRVNFPTDEQGDTYFAYQAFDFVKRNRRISEESAHFYEPERLEKNTCGIIKVGAGSFVGGFGIKECSVSPEGIISATLFKSFGRFMHTPTENNGAQLLQTMKFYYGFSVETDESKLVYLKKQMEKVYEATFTKETDLDNYIKVSENVVTSIIKPAENRNGFIIRVFNPCKEERTAEVTLNFEFDTVEIVNLEEEKTGVPQTEENIISFTVPPKKIVTLYVEI